MEIKGTKKYFRESVVLMKLVSLKYGSFHKPMSVTPHEN